MFLLSSISRLYVTVSCSDMSPQRDIFNNAIEHFSAEQEDIRSAASFAAGMPKFG